MTLDGFTKVEGGWEHPVGVFLSLATLRQLWRHTQDSEKAAEFLKAKAAFEDAKTAPVEVWTEERVAAFEEGIALWRAEQDAHRARRRAERPLGPERCPPVASVKPPYELHKFNLAQYDPNGKDPHESGAKLDAGKVRVGLMQSDFAKALLEVAKVSTYGAEKYTDHGWRDVPDGIKRYFDAEYRHNNAVHRGEAVDQESGLLHLAHAAWNSLAVLELALASERTVI